ncbi:MAG: hypothetical protein J0M00_24290, partial [Burkholderiales bacterium]|nr:hypothetical protein [Burkholderiales bacterium]
GLGLGAVAPYVAAAAAAYYLGKKAFGRELADTGVQGSFSGSGDFTGDNYAFYKGGWFRNDKTRTSALDPGVEAALDAGARAAATSARSYAQVLGLPAAAIDGFTQQIQLSLQGLSQQQVQEKIAGAVTSFGEGLAARYQAALTPLQKGGETLAQTLQRLASLQTVSDDLNDLGGVFSRLARLSVDAREGLAELAGGLDALQSQALGYAQNYYTREEIAGLKASELMSALSGVGLQGGNLRSREDFRALVDRIDVNSTQGRQQLATLLSVQGAAASVFDFQAEVGGNLASTTALAPQAGALSDLFGPGGQLEQLNAINAVANGVDRVRDAVLQVVDAVKSTRPGAALAPGWEVGMWNATAENAI